MRIGIDLGGTKIEGIILDKMVVSKPAVAYQPPVAIITAPSLSSAI